MTRLAYNTNGFPQHRLEDVCEILAGLGYDGVAITPDRFHLDPFGDGPARAPDLARRLADLGLSVAVETGARFLLDRERKHSPTLLDDGDGPARRLDLLRRCLDLAQVLGAETFSFWSGAAPAGQEPDQTLERLCRGAQALLDQGAGDVRLCFEPEPGMAVASLAQFQAFAARLGREQLLLMLDVGHLPVTEQDEPAAIVTRWAPRLGGLQLDDSTGAHEHLLPGDGAIDFRAVLAAAQQGGFDGLASVELPRHAHDPVQTARAALAYLRARQPGP